MRLIPWKKKNELAQRLDPWEVMQREMNSFFDTALTPWSDFSGFDRAWTPALDVQETKDEVIIKADLPGLEKKDIQLTVENGMLVLSGERHHEEEKDEKGWHRVERSSGSFRRIVRLPSAVDEKKVKAEYKDGVLTARLPKTEDAKTKKIEIQ